MTFTPKLLEQYRECERALLEAERLLQDESSSAARLSELEKLLSTDNNAMAMIRKHREYGQRLPNVLGKLGDYKSKPQVEIANTIEPVSDAEMFEGNWAQCVAGCRAKNLEVATARQIAELRIKHGKDSIYCKNGGWVAENFNYLPNGDILVASRDYNPLLKYAEEATKAHIAGKEFYLYGGVIQGLYDEEKQGNVLLLKRKDVSDIIAVDAFGKEPLTAFLGWGKDYGEFLKGCSIENVNLYICDEKYVKKQKQAFSRALWANYLYLNSALYCDSSLDLSCGGGSGGRVFGVRRRGEQSGIGSTGPR
jgi:hypothetical protein